MNPIAPYTARLWKDFPDQTTPIDSVPLNHIEQGIKAVTDAYNGHDHLMADIKDLSIPQNTSDLNNDSGFITQGDIPPIPANTSDLNNDSGFITQSAIPTNVSQLANDSGFITASAIPSSLPANGGNADTVGGKSAGDFALQSLLNKLMHSDGTIKAYDEDFNNRIVTEFCYCEPNKNAPVQDRAGYLLVFKVTDRYVLQIWFSNAPTMYAYSGFIRAKSEGNWTNWKNIADGGNAVSAENAHLADLLFSGNIGEGNSLDNLDNYTPQERGRLILHTFDTASTGDKPFTDGFLMTYLWSNDSAEYGYFHQIALDDENYLIKTRYRANDYISPWTEILTRANTPKIASGQASFPSGSNSVDVSLSGFSSAPLIVATPYGSSISGLRVAQSNASYFTLASDDGAGKTFNWSAFEN